ncbi:MAG: hypothetical protein OXL96_08280 [Candidatus Poribacteria bacterium]|nr:hypothetical protein [Candidatus Poribacteria bacterium]
MKTLVIFSILMMVFTSCAIFTPQETQEERRRLLAMRDAARERHNPERVKEAVKELLVGKWQYVELEVEEGNVYAQRAKPVPQQAMDSLNTAIEGLSKGVAGEQTAAPNAVEQVPPPNSNAATPGEDKQESEVNQQNPQGEATRLPSIEVRDEKSNQRILGAKAALVASTRKNLILEFTEDRSSYYYSGSNRGTNVTGQCYVTTKRYGDDPLTFIRFNQRTGPELLEFLFGSEAIRQITAKQKQKAAEMTQNFNRKGALRATSRSISSMPGITVTDDTLSLVLYGDMQLTPTGWIRTGGLRCTFKRIE